MLIRKYEINDKNKIEHIGKLLHDNYTFNLDNFSKCLVITDDNKIVGFIVYSIIYERAEIVDIVIDSNYRKKSYGYKLLECAINDIIKNNCENISLEVNSINIPAINLYKKFNFNTVSVRKKYYGISDAYLMIKNLR